MGFGVTGGFLAVRPLMTEMHDPRDVPWYGWVLAPFLSMGIMLLIIAVVIVVIHGPFWIMV